MNIEEMSDDQILDEAKKQGYNENYDGENKKTPKEFLEIGLSHNHVLKERNDKLAKQIEEMSEKLEKQHDLAQKLVNDIEAQKKKAVEKAIRELKEEKKEAVRQGDVEKVEEIDKELGEHQENIAKVQTNPILDAWIERNSWYKDNTDEAAIEADIVAETLAKTGRFDLSNEKEYSRYLSEIEKRVKKAFPKKFTNPKKSDPAEVEPGRPSLIQKSKKTYEDLPPEAKQACDEFVANGIFEKREDYVAMYEWE